MARFVPKLHSRKTEAEAIPKLPIQLDSTTNGEYQPQPLPKHIQALNALARQRIDENARKLGVSRRQFLLSACSMATMLSCMNEVLAKNYRPYEVQPAMELDLEAAEAKLKGDEFIFDVQTHHVNPDRDWMKRNHTFDFLKQLPQANCGEKTWAQCYSRDQYIKEVFLDSDTDLAVLSAVPAVRNDNPLHEEEMAATRETVDRLKGTGRLMIHGLVLPNVSPLEAQLDGMDKLAQEWKIKAWKLYPLWGPKGEGYWLTDEKISIPVLEKARKLGIKTICIHKGLPLLNSSIPHSTCKEVGAVAKRFPDLTFIIYHSGFDFGVEEGPYDPKNAERGVNSLVRSLEENELKPNSNVYAELGATWNGLMRDPVAASHVLGKLMKYVGDKRVLWGTDSIWFGSPQQQIAAFRAFQIAPELQQKFGYPELTAERKGNIFGLNAAVPYGIRPEDWKKKVKSDAVSVARAEYREQPFPSFTTYGPRTRTELFDILRSKNWFPG